jgi:hypothetical protein
MSGSYCTCPVGRYVKRQRAGKKVDIRPDIYCSRCAGTGVAHRAPLTTKRYVHRWLNEMHTMSNPSPLALPGSTVKVLKRSRCEVCGVQWVPNAPGEGPPTEIECPTLLRDQLEHWKREAERIGEYRAAIKSYKRRITLLERRNRERNGDAA